MNSLLKISAITSAIFLVSACALTTKQSTTGKTESTPVTQSSKEWTSQIPAFKQEIRTCIIAHKSTTAIRYAEKKGSETHITLADKTASFNCIVNNQNQKLVSINPSLDKTPSNLPIFYPVGREVGSCKQSSKQLDTEGRFMGTICR